MSEVNFQQSAQKIMELIGGRENVASVTHCITRVRFTLKDQEKASANAEAIKSVPGVLQVVEAGGQYQVVIGPQVEKMYQAVTAIIGKMDSTSDDNTEVKKEKIKVIDLIMKLVSGIMLPVMPALVGCGITTALYNILSLMGVANSTEGIGMVLYGVGQTCFYFLPVLVGGSAAKFFGINVYIGNIIGAAMMYPTFIAAAGETIHLFNFLPLTFQNYSSTVFPAIVAVWFGSLLYKFFKKHIPDVLKSALVPTCTILITVPMALLIIGPVVNTISTLLSKIVLAVYNFSPIGCGILLGGTWLLFIVPLGLHYAFIAIFLNNMATIGYEPVWGLLSGIMTLSGTLFAVAAKSKNVDNRSLAISTGISNILGISEPGLYGIVLQHKETIITTFIAGAISGIIPAVCHTYKYVMGGAPGIFAFPGYIAPDGTMGSFIGAILCNIVGFILAFILTYFWKFNPDEIKN